MGPRYLKKPAVVKIKRIIIELAIIASAFILFILWHQNKFNNEVQTTISNMKYIKVHFITSFRGREYWETINQGAADMAAIAGVTYSWDAPEVRSTERQIELINEAVARGANALIIAADDPKSISSAVEDAKAKGVKIIYVDSPAYEEAITTLATDNYEAGVLAGQTMVSLLQDQEINGGSIGIINLSEKANTKIRENGFRDVLSRYPGYNILETIYTVNDEPAVTQVAAESIINNNKNLVALFGASEGTSIGVGNANKESGNKYVAVGFDKTTEMMKLLNSGSLNAIINQNPYTMGYLGMAQAIAAVLGKDTGPSYIDTGVTVVKKR